MKGLVRQSGFGRVNSIGIVRDAEANAVGAFQSVRTALANNGLPVPTAPLQVAAVGPRQAVALILPGDGAPGMLESLCLQSVAGDPAMPCVDAYFSCLEARLPVEQRPRVVDKARFQAFLASRREKALWIHAAVQQGYLDLRSAPFVDARALVTML